MNLITFKSEVTVFWTLFIGLLYPQLACLVAVVVADSYKTPIPILKDDRTQDAYGGYTFDFETGNGISRSEAGQQNDGQESSGAVR